MDRLVARRTRRHETVVAALKETALRSTVRLSTGLPVHVSIAYFVYATFPVYMALERENTLFTRTNIIEVISVKFGNNIIFPAPKSSYIF